MRPGARCAIIEKHASAFRAIRGLMACADYFVAAFVPSSVGDDERASHPRRLCLVRPAKMIANILSFTRLGIAVVFAATVAWAGTSYTLSLWGGILLIILALMLESTDVLDGFIARSTGTASQLGGILDPFIDSLARLTVYFAMALAGWITIAVPLVMTARDIVVAYSRIIQALTGGQTSARISGKVKAAVQAIGVFALILVQLNRAGMAPSTIDGARMAVAAAIIAVTLWSLMDYARNAIPGLRTLLQRQRGHSTL